MKKIAMFLDSSFPPDSRVENEAVSLIHAGHKVFIFSLDYEGRKKTEIVNRIVVHRYRVSKITYKLSALAYTLPFFHCIVKPLISKFIKIVNPDVIHIHDMVIAKSVMDVCSGFKIVLDLHENRPEIMQYYKHITGDLGKWLIDLRKWKIAQNQLINRADKLILVSEEAKQIAIQQTAISPDNVVVVPNTILPTIYLQYPIDQQLVSKYSHTYNILYLGDTSLRRGTDTAIRSIDKIKDVVPNIRLILVGKSSADKELKALVASLNLEEFVIFEGWKDVSMFPSYTKVANVCISPLKRNLHHDTTFANKIFQYMCMAKPIVVSDCTTQANLVFSQKCGLVFEADNCVDFADKIIELYQKPLLSKQLGNNGKKSVEEKWNWDITSKDLIELYDQI